MKKSKKQQSSKAKLKNTGFSTIKKVKLHTKTKSSKNKQKVENLTLAAFKIPDTQYSTKIDVLKIIQDNNSHLPKKQTKLISEKINEMTESEINEYAKKKITLPELMKKLITTRSHT